MSRRSAAALGLICLALVAGTGCTAVSDPQGAIDQSRLVNDLAVRLNRADSLTYTAEYQLSDGRDASIAQSQNPVRAAYTYPGGKLVVTAEATTACETVDKVARCTLSTPPSPPTDPTTALLTEMVNRGLVLPTLVADLLSAAALDPDAVVRESDTTIVGEHASCLDISGVTDAKASAFTVCVLSNGVLGRFTGTVQGRDVSVNMVRYTETADPAGFDLPANAQVTDQRAGR